MSNWFRHRGPQEGQGYSVANWQGAVASIVFIALEACTAIGAVLAVKAGASIVMAVAGGMIAFVVILIGFIALVRAKSDWKG